MALHSPLSCLPFAVPFYECCSKKLLKMQVFFLWL